MISRRTNCWSDQPQLSRLWWTGAWVAGVVLGLALLGCRRPVVSPEAQPWPSAAQDERENGPEIGVWPMFRGINAQGIGIAARPPVEFGPDKNLRWKAALSGKGNSSPVVWRDTVFVTTAEGQSDSRIAVVLAFRRSDGQLLWRREVGSVSGETHSKNGYASPSAACDGERVVAYFGSAGLICLDLQGNELWRKDLGPQKHMYGVGSSPIIADRYVIQLCDREQDSFLVALEKTTGKEVWRTPRPTTGCWTTPVVVRLKSHDPLLVINGGEVGSAGRLAAYNLADGQEVWHRDDLQTLVTPVALWYRDLLLGMSGRNGPILALNLHDPRQPELRWMLPRGGPYIPSALIYRNRFYVLSDARWITCYNPGDGAEIWRGRLTGEFSASLVAADGRIYAVNERGTVFVLAAGDEFQLLAENRIGERCLATPALVDNELILRTDRSLYCFAEPESGQGEAARGSQPSKPAAADKPSPGNPDNTVLPREAPSPTNRSAPTGTSSAPPAAAGDESGSATPAAEPASEQPSPSVPSVTRDWPVFRGTSAGTGFALANLPEKPTQTWLFSTERDQFQATPIVAEGTVFIGSSDGTFFAIDLRTGKLRWKSEGHPGFAAPAGYHEGTVSVGDIDGRFHCFHAADGKPLWTFQTDGEIDGGPNFVTLPDGKRAVLFGSQDVNLYCVDARSGQLLWKAASGDQIRCCPPVVDHTTFVAGCDGKLHVMAVEDGHETAAIDLGGPTGCTPALLGEYAYVGTENGLFYGIAWKKTQIAWKFEEPKEGDAFRSSAAVNERFVVVGSRDRKVHCFDRLRGEHRWEFATRRDVDASPVIVRRDPKQRPEDDWVIAASLDGHLYCLRIGDGNLIWDITVGGGISASPVVAEGRIIVATEDGDIACFGG